MLASLDPTALEPAWAAQVTARDRRILALARRKLGIESARDFAEALRALREAVEEAIPAGRVYVLAHSADAVLVGSLLSGVGIVETRAGVVVERIDARGRRRALGPLLP